MSYFEPIKVEVRKGLLNSIRGLNVFGENIGDRIHSQINRVHPPSY